MSWVDVDQRSTDWLHMRCGSITASPFWKVRDRTKNGAESAKRVEYKLEKVCECLTGLAEETYVTPAMERGIELEPLARTAYEMERECEVTNGGLYIHDSITRLCASPDGRIGDDGLIEIKCPSRAAHLDCVMNGTIPDKYLWQMHCQLACAPERDYVDFVSYDPRFKPPLNLWIKRVERDPKMVNAVELEAMQFLEEVIAILQKLGQKAFDLKGRDLVPVLEASVREARA